MELGAGTGCQFDPAIAAQQGLARASPGFDAHHRPWWLGPEHHQIEGVAELQFERGAGCLIHQPHWTGGAHQQINALAQAIHLLSRGSGFHGEVIQAFGW